MIQNMVKLNILTALFLICVFNYLPAQGAQDRPAGVLHAPGERYSSEEARQHYQQGKDFYSLGRYEEARVEFERALESISPPRAVTEAAEQQKALEIAPPVKEAPAAPLPEQAQEERQYYIDFGDILDISVWQIPDLSKSEVIVRPDGKISFPLIGDINAEGLTLTQLDNILTQKLETYVKAPEVSIMIRRFGAQSNKVVILGEVPTPGVYKFSGPPTITELIASAGGYTKYSVINSVMVIRGVGMGKKPEVTRINLVDILKGNKYSNNIFLKPNDIIYIPRSFIGNLNTFLELIQPAISEYMKTWDAGRFHNKVGNTD